ncbi:MAG TPA: hypothetical protein VJ970_03670, partial [Flavobacteriaceae bacterium]|nr:hypothetical protein [Flavobacteriaceae bacterium]
MNFQYLTPIDAALLAKAKLQSNQTLGNVIEIYSTEDEFPDVSNKKIAIIGVEEDRASINNHGTG